MAAERTIGTTLYKTSGTPGYISSLSKITAFGKSAKDIDITDLDVTNNHSQFMQGIIDPGELQCEGFVKTEAQMTTLQTLIDGGTTESFIITLPSGGKWYIQGYLKSFMEGDITVDGARTFKFNIKISGRPEYFPTGISA